MFSFRRIPAETLALTTLLQHFPKWSDSCNLAPRKAVNLAQRTIEMLIGRLITDKKVAASANPDMLVAYHASFDKEIEINATSTGWGPLRLGVGTGSARATQVVVGTLVLDMMDPGNQDRNLAWNGQPGA